MTCSSLTLGQMEIGRAAYKIGQAINKRQLVEAATP
jgi:hypothetical protein